MYKNKRKVGSYYEDEAVKYLQSKGHVILERNFHSRHGEIDIISRDGDYYVIVEVKYRAGDGHGNPLESVNVSKQKRICMTTRYYMCKNGISPNTDIRFDVISFEGEKLTHIENAFEYI